MTFTPRIKNKLTFPQLKIKEGEPVFIKCTGLIYTGKEVPDSDMEAPQLMRCIDLTSGEECEIVVGKILEDILTDLDGGYVDKCFQIKQLPSPEGKRWRPYEVAEIESPTDD